VGGVEVFYKKIRMVFEDYAEALEFQTKLPEAVIVEQPGLWEDECTSTTPE
jgi:hypothetical protein